MFEEQEKKLSVMEAHLKGLKGQLETLRGWGQSTDKNYQKFFLRTFGHENNKQAFENLYNNIDELLNSGKVDQESYDKIYKTWNELNKLIGN